MLASSQAGQTNCLIEFETLCINLVFATTVLMQKESKVKTLLVEKVLNFNCIHVLDIYPTVQILTSTGQHTVCDPYLGS